MIQTGILLVLNMNPKMTTKTEGVLWRRKIER
jgi:hypothetical protein